jgi:hypothetical protein
MATNIHRRADCALIVAHNDDRLETNVIEKVIARAGNRSDVSGDNPMAKEELVDVAAMNGRIDEEIARQIVPRQALCGEEGPRRGVVGVSAG